MAEAVWNFWDPPETLVESTRQVVREGRPIVLVVRDLDSHRWQFLSDSTFELDDVVPTTLGEIVRRDPSILSIASLPRGWHARRHDGEEWRQERHVPSMPAVA